jgi:capsular exopolysaccharide synthesis family protein
MTTFPGSNEFPAIPAEAIPALPGGLDAGPASAAASVGPTGRDILRVLRKRFWLILISGVGVLALTCAATLVWQLYAPLFEASATMHVSPPGGAESTPGRLQYGADIMNRIVQNHAMMAKNDGVLKAAALDRELTSTAWYNKDKKDVLRRLDDDIDVMAVPGTDMIRISMVGLCKNEGQRTELANIVNAVARAFETFSTSTSKGEANQDISLLQDQVQSLTADYARTDEQINRLGRGVGQEEGPAALEERRNTLVAELRKLATDSTPLLQQKSAFERSLQNLQQQLQDNTLASSPEVLLQLESDREYLQLRSQVRGLESQLIRQQTKFAPGHSEIKSTEALLENTRQQYDDRRSQLVPQVVQRMLSSAQVNLDATNGAILALQTRMDEAQRSVSAIEAQLSRMQSLSDERNRLQDSINRLQDRLLQYRILMESEAQVRVAYPAVPPRTRHMPRWSIMVPLGILLGAMVGFGLAFMLEFIDTSIKGPSDVARRVDVPLLGMVPHSDDIEEQIEDMRVALLTHPTSLVGEAFRQIRTCLMFSGPPSHRRSLLVTSALPEDGRTTVAINLAACCAQGDRKILVVDANFRQPAIRGLFPDCPDGGLSSALVGQADWRDLVKQVQGGLYVLPSGVLPPNPAELLGSDQMKQLIDEMTDSYEQVIIDGAPCLLVSDSPILSTLVDGVILTIRAGANTYGIVQRTRDVLQRVGAHVVGAVLNGVRASAGGYLRENYERFYEYHERRQIPAQKV